MPAVREFRLHAFGGPEVLTLEERPAPACPERGYLVSTRAVGLNFADVVERRGRYRREQALPLSVGREAAGVVAQAGPQARRFRPGDEVIVFKFGGGCYADTIAATEDEVLEPPAGYSCAEQAAFAASFATAWYALRELARVRPGESALVQAAAGGVGTAAVKLLRALGAGPILGTAGTPEKCALVERLGADCCVDYSLQDFREEVRRRTQGRGVDFCLESVGGEVYQRSLEVLAPLGRLVMIGFSSIERDYGERIPRLHPLTLFHRSIAVAGLNVEGLRFVERPREWGRLLAFCAEHELRPHVGRTFRFEEAALAQAELEGRRSVGKVVLVL